MNKSVQESSNKRNNPWISIWFHPRKTIRQIGDDNPRYGFVLLAVLFGIYRFIEQSSKQSLGDLLPLGAIIGLSIILSIFIGYLNFYILGACMHMVGTIWFDGRASIEESRAAAAWSSLPEMLGLVIYIPIIFIFKESWFVSNPEINLLTLLRISYVLVPFGLIIRFWRAILFIECFAELNEFTFWRSLIVSAICFSIFFIAVLLLVLGRDFIFGRL